MAQKGKVLLVDYDVVTDKSTFPSARTALTGTVSAGAGDTRLVGVGTLFTKEVEPDDFIYIAAEVEIRRVESIIDDLTLLLVKGFTGVLAGASADGFDDVPHFREVTILNQGTADGKLLGKTLKPNFPIVIHTDEERPVQPINYDATGAGVEFSFLTTH